MLYVSSNIVVGVPAYIDTEYGNIAKMTIMRGKIHKYLGIAIEYSYSEKVILYMVNYIGNMFDKIPKDTKGESATPAIHHLFDVAEYATFVSFGILSNMFPI